MPVEPPDDGDPLTPRLLSPADVRALLNAERAGKPVLVYRDASRQLRLFTLPGTDGVVTVGRLEEMDVTLPWDPRVSGLHAELHTLGSETAILDDGLSTNGTYLNGERVSGRRRLRDGDRVRVGRTVLAFRLFRRSPTATVAATTPTSLALTASQRRVLVALCRPLLAETGSATPATNHQIADELHLSLAAVKRHLSVVFTKFEIGELGQNEKRAKLAELAMRLGVVSSRDVA